ncbi:MAG: outer membrane beta-barrel protein [Spirochaetaceae bacterium]|nr:outer membrane beta-barrel protein [Spirochaetaceae bacterium]
MRIFATLLSVALLSIPGAGLFAQDMMMAGTGFYVAAGGGVTLITDISEVPEKGIAGNEDKADWDLDFGFGAGGSAGYDFGDFRAEAEFSFQSANFRHGEKIDKDADREADDNLTVMSILANGFFDLDTGTPFVPFIGIGAGAVNLAVKLDDGNDDTDPLFEGNGWGFAYQANVGVAYEIIDAVALTLGYKFFGTLETQVPHPDDEEKYVKPTLMAHRAELGVRFSF